MPGIVGAILGHRPAAAAAVEAMRDLLVYRPSYTKIPTFINDDFCLGGAFVPSSARGRQPVDRGPVLVWVDGEIYNREELAARNRVTARGDEALFAELFRTDPNLSFLAECDGLFTAVLFDPSNRKLHWISDCYGFKHLFFAEWSGGLAWASEQKCFQALPGYSPKIDRTAVLDYVAKGQFPGDRSWFEQVWLLPPATILTWDCATRAKSMRRYWSWDGIRPMQGRVDPAAIAEELGRLFMDSVRRRTNPGERILVPLSGGLDSRAILAALPAGLDSVTAFTFGSTGCVDIRTAARVAARRGVSHRTFAIDHAHWLSGRFPGVWWTDGQLNLLHLHDVDVLAELADSADVCLNGYLGDAVLGGQYLYNRSIPETVKYETRGRRFIRMGVRLDEVFFIARAPFYDVKLVRFALSLPERLRTHSYIYNRMLVERFPEYYRDIPWQKSGIPISAPSLLTNAAIIAKKVRGKTAEFLGARWLEPPDGFADYATMLRSAEAWATVTRLLGNPESLCSDILDTAEISRALSVGPANARSVEMLGRYLTCEIWLQQLLRGRYRTPGE
jgi:asparagine synthase (glutamine-hydrolysing)